MAKHKKGKYADSLGEKPLFQLTLQSNDLKIEMNQRHNEANVN